MHLLNTPLYYAKYKKEESKVKALMELIIIKRGVTRVTATEKRNVNIGVILEHYF